MHGVTHEEKFIGKKPNISHMKVFGGIAYVHILDEKREKLDPKEEKCYWIFSAASEHRGGI